MTTVSSTGDRSRGLVFAWAMLLAVSCSGGGSSTAIGGDATLVGGQNSVPTAVGEGGCPFPAGHFGPGDEVRAVATGGSLWALVFGHQPLPIKVEVKIVWAAVGHGELLLTAASPDGAPLQPAHLPVALGGDNWDRPGGHFGSSFRFPTAGCWRIHAARGNVAGDIWLEVGKRSTSDTEASVPSSVP